jgi:4-hydroxybenzoate polyprenyltransferase
MMNNSNKYSDFLWNEFIYGGHWISLGAIAIALSTIIILKIMIRWEFILIIYLGTLSIYRYNHYKEIDFDSQTNSERTNHLKKYQKYLPYVIFLSGIMFFILLLLFGNLQSLFFGIFLYVLGILFTQPFKKFTKKIIGFKSMYTSFSLSLSIIFTAVYYSYLFNDLLAVFFIFGLIRFFIGTSYSDIKDITIDNNNHLRTLPIVMGVDKFLIFLHILNIFSFIPIIIGVYMNILPALSLLLVFSLFYSYYYIQKARNKKEDAQSMTNIIVDGEFIFWPLLLFIGLVITI